MRWISLFVEPLFLIGVSLIVVVLINKYKSKYLSKVLFVVLLLYLFLTAPLGANFIIAQVENANIDNHCLKESVDAVVILSGGITGDPTAIDEIWRLKESSYRRTLFGLKLAQDLNINNIIVSGGYGGRFTEADVMANLIKKIGFSGKVIVDSGSKTTYVSAINVAKILKGLDVSKFWLVTSALHLPRASASFEKQGISFCRYPVDSQYISTAFPGNLLPQITALNKSTAAFHEIIGSFWYVISDKY